MRALRHFTLLGRAAAPLPGFAQLSGAKLYFLALERLIDPTNGPSGGWRVF
jgi:hypothetical protein